MSKRTAETFVDGDGNQTDVVYNGEYNEEFSEALHDMVDTISEADKKKEISRLNRHIVAELKSEIKTVIIALNRAASLDELHEAAEFFADTSVDIKLVKRAIRALVKEGKLVESAKNSFELSQQKVDFYAALANLKKNPSRRLS